MNWQEFEGLVRSEDFDDVIRVLLLCVVNGYRGEIRITGTQMLIGHAH